VGEVNSELGKHWSNDYANPNQPSTSRERICCYSYSRPGAGPGLEIVSLDGITVLLEWATAGGRDELHRLTAGEGGLGAQLSLRICAEVEGHPLQPAAGEGA
jgi:hypothetical protein